MNHNFEDGEICVICEKQFAEAYGRPAACEDCGGDGVLATYENQHQGY
jgi:DnaJ-class molecular chaperone